MHFDNARIHMMGVERPHEGGNPCQDTANWSARPHPEPDAAWLALLPTGTSSRAVVATLLLTMAAAPFLKGILAGFALAGAAAAVRGVLGV